MRAAGPVDVRHLVDEPDPDAPVRVVSESVTADNVFGILTILAVDALIIGTRESDERMSAYYVGYLHALKDAQHLWRVAPGKVVDACITVQNGHKMRHPGEGKQ